MRNCNYNQVVPDENTENDNDNIFSDKHILTNPISKTELISSVNEIPSTPNNEEEDCNERDACSSNKSLDESHWQNYNEQAAITFKKQNTMHSDILNASNDNDLKFTSNKRLKNPGLLCKIFPSLTFYWLKFKENFSGGSGNDPYVECKVKTANSLVKKK